MEGEKQKCEWERERVINQAPAAFFWHNRMKARAASGYAIRKCPPLLYVLQSNVFPLPSITTRHPQYHLQAEEIELDTFDSLGSHFFYHRFCCYRPPPFCWYGPLESKAFESARLGERLDRAQGGLLKGTPWDGSMRYLRWKTWEDVFERLWWIFEGAGGSGGMKHFFSWICKKCSARRENRKFIKLGKQQC